jgi:hypothetical protein
MIQYRETVIKKIVESSDSTSLEIVIDHSSFYKSH